jgi:hypothetical protein
MAVPFDAAFVSFDARPGTFDGLAVVTYIEVEYVHSTDVGFDQPTLIAFASDG